MLRREVCRAIPHLPQKLCKHWTSLLGGEDEMRRFLALHATEGEWTDDMGIMVAATATFIERHVVIVEPGLGGGG